jgi:hypothetical protein
MQSVAIVLPSSIWIEAGLMKCLEPIPDTAFIVRAASAENIIIVRAQIRDRFIRKVARRVHRYAL